MELNADFAHQLLNDELIVEIVAGHYFIVFQRGDLLYIVGSFDDEIDAEIAVSTLNDIGLENHDDICFRFTNTRIVDFSRRFTLCRRFYENEEIGL